MKPSPRMVGVPKSAKACMNTISVAARMVGMVRCSTMLKSLFTPVQPMLSDASMSVLSMLLNAPFI